MASEVQKNSWSRLRGRPLQRLISMAASSGFLLFGYDQGVLAGLITGPAFQQTFNYPSSSLLGLIVSIYEIGCCCGALLTFVIGEPLGRRYSIALGLVIMLVGTALQASAFSVPHMLVGRIVTGIGNGINTSSIPTYQAETSPAKSRGRLIAFEGWFITLGIVISYWVTYGTSNVENPDIQFRTPIALQAVFAIIILGLISMLPESPRWLMRHGKPEEAAQVLAALNEDRNVDENSYVVQEQISEIQMVLEAETGSVMDILKDKHARIPFRLCLAYGIQMMQQLTGVNAIIFYVPILLESTMNLPHDLALIVSGCTGICFFVFSFVPVLWIEHYGRRKPLLFGATCQAISMLLIAVLLKVGGKGCQTAAVIFIFVYIAVYSVGWLPIPWLYPTEIVPLRFRSQGTALSTSANWIWNFLVVQITPIGVQHLGWQFYLIFMALNAAFVPIIYFLYPETSGKTLEELDLLYSDKDADPNCNAHTKVAV